MSTQSLERSPAEVVPMDDDQLLPLGDSILASWIRSICQTVRGYGVSPEAIFERIGMDSTLLTVPDARYPAMTVRRFWEAVISATGDELIGLTCGQEMQAPTLHGLGLAIMTSHSPCKSSKDHSKPRNEVDTSL
ncbi:AraC family transcriptional regulator ligand-binding domain-containing protein, partial [Sutterella wadsworthensis]|uniref:AraC family transcriptional regulator ligand-binding domain-containing protein n=1 Tax=Sutterella wadsworthensis TaxID=40545 RepID=UPI00307A7FAF